MNELGIGVAEEEKPKSKQEMVITELISHINSLEEKINTINNNLSEIKDVQLVDKLDIINLKNETEKIRTSTRSITPETQQTIEEVHELADDIKHIKKIKNLEKTINDLKKELEKNFKEIENLRVLYKGIVTKISPASSKKILETRKPLKRNEKQNKQCIECKKILPWKSKFCTGCGKGL